MDKKVLDYFVKLNKIKVPKNRNGIIVVDMLKTHKSDDGKKIIINNVPCFYKEDFHPRLLSGITASRMYKALGIPTPVTSLATGIFGNTIHTLSQDVKGLEEKGYDISIASDTPLFKLLMKPADNRGVASNKFADFADEKINVLMLKFMTNDCLDELKNIILLDELRTDPDRHWHNFFFYKKQGAKKWEGIIPIDLELSYIFTTNNARYKFFDHSYSSYTLLGDRDCFLTLSKRMNNVKDAIQKGYLNESQLNTLKQGVTFNYPYLVSTLQKKYFPNSKTTITDNINYLWNHNYQALKDELSL